MATTKQPENVVILTDQREEQEMRRDDRLCYRVEEAGMIEHRNRVKELDLTKSFIIIIGMIGIHVLYHLADYQVLSSSITANVLNILATAWAAPVFMFCMGVTLGFSRHQNPSDWLHRGVHLITIGMVLNILRWGPYAFTALATDNPELMKGVAMIFTVDILQFAGLAFMLMALCKHLKMSVWGILALSILMNIAGTLLIGLYTPSFVANQVLGFFYHTPTASCFPLLNWFIFVAAGNALGKLYRESDNLDRIFCYIIPVCGVIAIVHQYLSITGSVSFFKTLENDWEYYNMETPDALCIAFGVAPFMIGLFRLVGKIIPDKWMVTLGYPSRHINQFFCVSWVWIMWTYCFLYQIAPATTVSDFIIRWVIITILTTVTILIYNRYLINRITPLFGRHETAWNIGIWVTVIVLGVLYFLNIQGPYLMPY